MKEIKKLRKHMKISGRVQGVGFRFRAQYAASGYGITGWVKNQMDGTVEMEVQGISEQIDNMLVMLVNSPYIVIERIDVKEMPLQDGEYGFHIR